MTTPEYQLRIVFRLLGTLWQYVRRQRLPWYVVGELAVTMPRPDGRTLTLGPDLLMAVALSEMRTSWDVVDEGQPPAFVLEVVTAESVTRDTVDKRDLYDEMGVREYAIYWWGRKDGGPFLFGHRRTATGAWEPWATDPDGVLRSEAMSGLGLWRDAEGWLRLADRQGRLLPTPDEEAIRAEQEALRAEWEAARADREAARADKEAARAEREAAARRAAEAAAEAAQAAAIAEIARLRRLLEARDQRDERASNSAGS